MNPLLVETALQSAFATLAFPTTQIYTGTDYEELSPESLNLIISCGQVDHTAGGLYKAQITVRIVSPALLWETAKTEMVAALNSVRTALGSSYLTTNWPTSAGTPTYGGVWITGTKTSQDNHGWVAEVDAIIGVSE